MGFPGGSAVKNLPANAGDTGDVGLIPRQGCYPENEMKLALVFLPRKSRGLEGYSPEGCKEYDMTQ